MSDRLLKESDVLDAVLGWETDPLDEELERAIKSLPSADAVDIKAIYDAGYSGKEVRFRIGGRLFAVRELPQ